MRIGVLGTGTVGEALAGKLRELGHEVLVGSRNAGDGHLTFAEAAERSETIVNATNGVHSLAALGAAGAEHLAGKVLIDVANPIAPDSGMPPTLAFCNTESLGERIQAGFPEARVVKALNTVNAGVMVDPGGLPEPTEVFICGNDGAAKRATAELLSAFGWEPGRIVDLGGIEAARGVEMYLAFWLRAMSALGSPRFNLRLVRAE